MEPSDRDSREVFDPRRFVEILELPEGTRSINLLTRTLFFRGEKAYDPLWCYVHPVDKRLYRGQGIHVRIGQFSIGMRAPNRIAAFADFRQGLLYVGRKLVIPFSSIQGVVAGQGMLPWRRTPVFVMLVKVFGCDKYIPIHQCVLDATVVELADFLSSHMHSPLGIASSPLHFWVPPGSDCIRHSLGETALCDVRGMFVSRGPDGRTRIKLMMTAGSLCILDEPDPLGWIENWGILADELLSIVTRRDRRRYGQTDG